MYYIIIYFSCFFAAALLTHSREIAVLVLDIEEDLEDMDGRNCIDSPISDGTIEEDFEQALAK